MEEELGRSLYHSQDLDPSTSEVRLIRLLPSDNSNTIECELFKANLADLPLYEALSYEWGNTPPDKLSIQFNGQGYSTRDNLWWALYHLRFQGKSRYLWIDALCINQSNNREKSHQIALMGKIYSLAVGVVAWIGLEDAAPDSAESSQVMEDGRNEIQVAVDCLSRLNYLYSIKRPPTDTGYSDQERQAVERLCHRSYWTRLWVIQEFVLASRIQLQAGSVVFDPIILTAFSVGDRPTWAPYQFIELREDRSHFRTYSRTKVAHNGLEEPTLLNLIWTVNKAKCSMIHDHIFGILSLSQECCQRAVPPDYSKSFAEICLLVLQHEAERHNGVTHELREKLLVVLDFPVRALETQHQDSELFQTSALIEGKVAWIYEPSPTGDIFINSPSDMENTQLLPVLQTINKYNDSWNSPGYLLSGSFAPKKLRDLCVSQKAAAPFKDSKSWARIPISIARNSIKPTKKPEQEKQKTQDRIDELWNLWKQTVKEETPHLRAQGLCLFFTDEGKIGYVSKGGKVGDTVCSFGGPYSSAWIGVVHAATIVLSRKGCLYRRPNLKCGARNANTL